MIVGIAIQSHGAHTAASSLHSNVDMRSSAENSNSALVSTVEWSGAEWIVVIGGRCGIGGRTSHANVEGVGSALPEASTARTSKARSPTGTIMLCGLAQRVQSCAAELSRRHSKWIELELSVPLNRNVATSSCVVSGGVASSTVLG